MFKSIFIQGMNNQQIQMDLLSEARTPAETLQYALARERGQESQQKIININTNPNTSNPWFEEIQHIKRQNKIPILPTPHTGQIQDCQRCGNKFLPGHLNVCPSAQHKTMLVGYAKRSATLPSFASPKCHRDHSKTCNKEDNKDTRDNNNQRVTKPTSQRIRNINEEETDDTEESVEEKTDPDSTCYIREMMEDWQNTANFIQSVQFTNEKMTDINNTNRVKLNQDPHYKKKQPRIKHLYSINQKTAQGTKQEENRKYACST